LVLSEWRSRIQKEWIAIGVGLLFLWGVIGVMGAAWWLNRATGAKAQVVLIEPGMTVGEIGLRLYQADLIRSPQLLRVFARLDGAGRKLMAGPHPFHGNMTTWQVLQELGIPREKLVDITIPEGMRMTQVAQILAKRLDLNEKELLRWMADPDFCKSLGVPADNLEGYLFPETHKVSAATSEKKILSTLVSHFFAGFDKDFQERAKKIGMSLHEVVILASIVEGEAQLDNERSTIAAVYHNRLKKNMRLQADPTVQYALPGKPRRLFYKDYQYESPYNTYRHNGLPPGPISSPGKASIEAVLYPANVDYIYFVARGDGSHVFSRTSQEHEEAKQKTASARRKTWKKAN
jgi:UPF0755 protein